MVNDKALQPLEQKNVLFYDDEITAVLIQDGEQDQVYIPVRPICTYLGINWSGQYQRLQRDRVLAETLKTISVEFTAEQGSTQDMVCLPLKYLPGWLFGINANRIKEDLQDKIIRYQRECYDVLWEAFEERRLTGDPAFTELLQQDSEAVEAYKMLQALVKIARQQILIEARMKTYDGRLLDHENRIETIEAQFGDETRTVSEDQASQISQAVKAIALTVSKRTGRNEYGGVYGELYRKFAVTSYKLVPATQFKEAMKFLIDWHQSVVDTDTPF